MALRKIGEGVTDSNGRCIISYTGTGAGLLQLKGQCADGDSIIQSEPYSVWDTIFNIDCTQSSEYWETTLDVEPTSEGTHFKYLTTGSSVNVKINNSIHPFDGTQDLIFDFNFKTANTISVYVVDNAGSRRGTLDSSIPHNTWVHYQWKYNATSKQIQIYRDNVLVNTYDGSSVNFTTIGFQIYDWNSDADFWINNWKLYKG